VPSPRSCRWGTGPPGPLSTPLFIITRKVDNQITVWTILSCRTFVNVSFQTRLIKRILALLDYWFWVKSMIRRMSFILHNASAKSNYRIPANLWLQNHFSILKKRCAISQAHNTRLALEHCQNNWLLTGCLGVHSRNNRSVAGLEKTWCIQKMVAYCLLASNCSPVLGSWDCGKVWR